MLEQLKERNMELLEQISQLKLKLQALDNDQLRKIFIELTIIPYFVRITHHSPNSLGRKVNDKI